METENNLHEAKGETAWQAKEWESSPFATGRRAAFAAKASERLLLVSVKQAIYDNQLELCCKPVFQTDTGRLIGMEASMCWNHQALGELLAEEYMPAVERSGMLLPFGERLIKAACERLRDYQSYLNPNLLIIVRMTARQLMLPQFAEFILFTLRECGLHPSSLVIAIEAGEIHVPQKAVISLTKLRAAGVRLMLYGMTPDSTPMLLRDLPFTSIQLQAPHMFTKEGDGINSGMAASVIAAAHELGMSVVAGGIVYREQVEWLKACGCDYMQGYLFVQSKQTVRMDEELLPCYSELPLHANESNLIFA